jgi:hypothetical protein
MPNRRLPVRPDLDQLKHQAKDLLRAIRSADPDALADLATHHVKRIAPAAAKLADAQLVLARSYGVRSWPRLVAACRMTDAIWRGDALAVRAMVLRDPVLLAEDARGSASSWGPPMSYAANLGQDAIVEMLGDLGAADLAQAFNRACLQGRIATARRLHAMMGNPEPAADALHDPAYTLNVAGTELLLELGARARAQDIGVVLETDGRDRHARHRILDLYEQHGLTVPDTPVMAVYRGRLDRLDDHVRRDPQLLRCTFSHAELYPPALGGHGDPLATHGTPLDGATLLHLAIDYDELDVCSWLLDHGMHVDEPAAIDRDGFGGHTALFSTVVSQPAFWRRDAAFAQLLLDRGANPNARASLRKRLHPGYQIDGVHEYRDVTPIEWGERFVFQRLVNRAAMAAIAA